MNKIILIAEIGINHNGDMDIAKKLINIAKNCGCDAVKFQLFKAQNLVPVNSNVRAKTKLLEAQPKAGGTQLISEVSIEIEGQDRPAMIAETVSIVFE